MEKQNNFRLSKTKNNILYILSGAALALFAGLMLFPTITETTHAEGDEPDDGITITVNGEVDANLVLFNEGDYKIAKDTVSVSSSAPYGYELFLTTDSEAHQSIYLNDDPTSESRIAPVSGTIAEPAVLTNNTWGFAIAGQGNFDDNYDPANPDPASRFAVIPTTADQQAVFENNAATAEDNIDFYYGIKVEPTLEVGEYTTSAAYTATAKLPPLTAKAILGSNKNLNFIYDRNTYTVGETYTDNIGETTITNIYDVPADSTSYRMWAYSGFKYANFDSSFHNFRPTSTARWFYYCREPFTITSPENLNTSNVTDMSEMFLGIGYDATRPHSIELDLSSWDTSKVTDMHGMFNNISDFYASTIHIILNDWDVNSVRNLSNMFGFIGGNILEELTLELKNWNVSKVSTANMFSARGTTSMNIDLSGWEVTGGPYSLDLFRDASYITSLNLNLSGWDVKRVGSTKTWFKNFGNFVLGNLNMDLSNWKNMTNIFSMEEMFSGAGPTGGNNMTFNLNLSGWDTSSVMNMKQMFFTTGQSAKTWSIGDISGWDTSNVEYMNGMLYRAGYNATTWDIGNLKNWNVTNVLNHDDFFEPSQSNIDQSRLPLW